MSKMGKILDNYTTYKKHVGEYNEWNKKQEQQKSAVQPSSANLKAKAKTIAEPILLFDKYEKEKAEDSETFFQTFNIELMSVVGAITTIPIAITKILPFLKKHANKNKFIEKTAKNIEKYAQKTIKLGSKSLPLPKALTAITAIAGGLIFMKGIKYSTESQLRIIRKASFDASQEKINDPKLFTILTPEQEKEVNEILAHNKKINNDFVDKLKDKIDINSSFATVGEYKKNLPNYLKKKQAYFDELSKPNQNNNKEMTASETKEAKENQQLYNGLIKTVEHDVLKPLQRVETISNIAYSSLFMGGFLEYLISNKLVNLMKIQNKPIRIIAKLGIPLLTYMLLNKNISDFENKAILATKYKHLKKFIEDPTSKNHSDETEKLSLPKFVKSVIKDMKDYNKFETEELPQIEARLEAKKQINVSNEQLEDAKALQKNTSMVLNTHREHFYNQTVGIETLSEGVLNPLDIVTTAIGGVLGHKLAKASGNKKLTGLFTLLGSLIAFIPSALAEVKFTKEQKQAEKIAAMLTMKDIEDYKRFANKKQTGNKFTMNNNLPEIFKEFLK